MSFSEGALFMFYKSLRWQSFCKKSHEGREKCFFQMVKLLLPEVLKNEKPLQRFETFSLTMKANVQV